MSIFTHVHVVFGSLGCCNGAATLTNTSRTPTRPLTSCLPWGQGQSRNELILSLLIWIPSSETVWSSVSSFFWESAHFFGFKFRLATRKFSNTSCMYDLWPRRYIGRPGRFSMSIHKAPFQLVQWGTMSVLPKDLSGSAKGYWLRCRDSRAFTVTFFVRYLQST